MMAAKPIVTRRSFLGACALSVPALSCGSRQEHAAEGALCRCTHTFKRVGDLDIKADVHSFDDGVVRPVVVWIHGGALMIGHRASVDSRIQKALLTRDGYTVVSIDYRLAPETKLPGLMEDIEDAFRWVREEGPQLFNADVSKIGVAGASAGGYLTLAAGYRVRPRPAALVSLFGYGELIGDWYSTPSPHPVHNRRPVTRQEALEQVSGPPVADARDRKGNAGLFYLYCRQNGVWPQEVSGWDPRTQAEKFDPYMPLRNVTPDYPPTLLLHGTADTDVPYEESVMMAQELEKAGVEHRLISLQGGEHGFGGADPDDIEQAYAAVRPFLDAHLKS